MGHFFFGRFLALLCFEFFFISGIAYQILVYFHTFCVFKCCRARSPNLFLYYHNSCYTSRRIGFFGCVEFKMMISFKMAFGLWMFLLDNRDSSTESWGDVQTPLSLEPFRPKMLQKERDLLEVLTFWKSHFSRVARYSWWTKSCTTKDDDYPIIYRVLTIPGGAGFCPSTVPSLSKHSYWQTFLYIGRRLVSVNRNEACLHQPQAGKNFLQVAWERKDETTVWVLMKRTSLGYGIYEFPF